MSAPFYNCATADDCIFHKIHHFTVQGFANNCDGNSFNCKYWIICYAEYKHTEIYARLVQRTSYIHIYIVSERERTRQYSRCLHPSRQKISKTRLNTQSRTGTVIHSCSWKKRKERCFLDKHGTFEAWKRWKSR